jgi:hypothetical protein
MGERVSRRGVLTGMALTAKGGDRLDDHQRVITTKSDRPVCPRPVSRPVSLARCPRSVHED